MTNLPNLSPESRDANLDAIADMMIHTDELDQLDLFELLAPLLSFFDRIELAARLDICPIHFRDIEICIDDNDPECADYRA